MNAASKDSIRAMISTVSAAGTAERTASALKMLTTMTPGQKLGTPKPADVAEGAQHRHASEPWQQPRDATPAELIGRLSGDEMVVRRIERKACRNQSEQE